jgi:hypothetical protein
MEVESMLNDTHIPILPIDICIPVQEFRVDYTIVQNTHLPIVREFILRLLDLNNFTKDQIGKFLGFTEKETSVALAQLINLDEAVVNDETKFQLTPKSRGYFSTQQENRPMVQSLEEIRKGFKFDLLTFSYVNSSESLGNPDNSIMINATQEAISLSAKTAKNAFQRYFHQIHEEEKFGYLKVKDPELYKISSFKKQSEKYKRLSQVYGVDPASNSFDPMIGHDFLSQDEVVTSLAGYFKDERPRNNVQEVSEVFDSIGFDYGVSSLKQGHLNVAEYSIDSRKSRMEENIYNPIIGSILLDDNWDSLLKNIDEAIGDRTTKEPIDILWIAPSQAYWATSIKQLSRFKSLTEKKNTNLQVYLPIPHRNDRKVSKAFLRQFGIIKESLHGFIEGYLTGGEEVVIINNERAFVFCYLYQNENMLPIPVGFHTNNKKIVSSLASSWSTYLSTLDEDFEPKELGPLQMAKK